MAPQPKSDPCDDPLLRDLPEHEGFKLLDRRYAIFDILGQGGMGVVFKGRHIKLEVDVAIKCLDPGLARRNADFVTRFHKEAQSAARIRHENVVQVMDVAEEGGLHFLVMEFVQGEDARRRVGRKGQLALDEAARITLGAAQGLAAAHSEGLVHRDVKPDNVLIGVDGAVKLADLGLAKSEESETGLTLSGATMGTPLYMPPEQYGDTKNVGPPADVYSLGATLYFLLTGRDGVSPGPFAKVYEQVLNQPFPDPRALRPEVPAELAELVLACTRKEASERPQRMDELVAILEVQLGGRGARLADPDAGTVALEPLVSPPPPQTLARICLSVERGEEGTPTTPAPAEPKPTAAGGWLGMVAAASVLVALVGGLAVLRPWESAPALVPDSTEVAHGSAEAAPSNDTAGVAISAAAEPSPTPDPSADAPPVEAQGAASSAGFEPPLAIQPEEPDSTIAEVPESQEAEPPAPAADGAAELPEDERLFREKLEQDRGEHGDEDPRTMDSMQKLASVLQDQERYDEAEQLLREALETKQRVFGDTHRSTLDSVKHLAALLTAQGRLEEAESLLPSARSAAPPRRELRERARASAPGEESEAPREERATPALPAPRLLQGHEGGLRSVAWSPDGRFIATGSNDKTLRIWDASSGQSLGSSSDHGIEPMNSVSAVAWSPDGTRLASGSTRGVRIWEVFSAARGRKGELRAGLALPTARSPLAWSPDGTRIVTGSKDRVLSIWDVRSGKSQRDLEGHKGSVLTVAWSPHRGDRIVSGSVDKSLRIWDAVSGESLAVLDGRGVVYAVGWSSDGGRIVSGSSPQGSMDGALTIWDAVSGESLSAFGSLERVSSVAFSPDAEHIGSGSMGGLQIWVTSTGEELVGLGGAPAPPQPGRPRGREEAHVTCLAWHPDGSQLVSGSSDGSASIWPAFR